MQMMMDEMSALDVGAHTGHKMVSTHKKQTDFVCKCDQRNCKSLSSSSQAALPEQIDSFSGIEPLRFLPLEKISAKQGIYTPLLRPPKFS